MRRKTENGKKKDKRRRKSEEGKEGKTGRKVSSFSVVLFFLLSFFNLELPLVEEILKVDQKLELLEILQIS